jgi:DNA-binding NtrC family response regulator
VKTDAMVLLVMPRTCRAELLAALENSATDVLAVCDCKEAKQVLKARVPVQVVFTDAVLPDGEWSDVMEAVEENLVNAQTIVCTRRADITLRTDVFERGAYDLLTEPYDDEEVQRIVEFAMAKSYMRSRYDSLAAAKSFNF